MEATLEVRADGGVWNALNAGRYDTCGGHDIPIKIKSVDGDKMAFTVLYNDTIQGCKDWNITLHRDPEGRVTGQRGETEFTLTRK